MTTALASALSLLHASLEGGIVLLAETVAEDRIKVQESFPGDQGLGDTIPVPHGLIGDELTICSATGIRLSLVWTILCGARPSHLAALKVPGHNRYVVVASVAGAPDGRLIEAAARVIGPLLNVGEATQAERSTAERINAVIRHLPVPVLLVNAQHPGVYVNDAARSLLGIRATDVREAAVTRALRRIFSSPEAHGRLAELSRNPYAELVFESSYDGSQLKVETRWIQDGAASGRLWVFSDVSEAKARERTLAQLASRDAVTGLLNRRAIDATLSSMRESALQSSGLFSVLIMDLDHFKAINDTYGHQTGDRVLRYAAKAASGAIRASDALGRYGGEEFVAALPHASLIGAIEVAERIRHAISNGGVMHRDASIAVTCSIGIATYNAGDTVEAVLERADAALYRAKRLGRNRIEAAQGAAPVSTSLMA